MHIEGAFVVSAKPHEFKCVNVLLDFKCANLLVALMYQKIHSLSELHCFKFVCQAVSMNLAIKFLVRIEVLNLFSI